MSSKPVGSGYFAAVAGLVFFVAATATLFAAVVTWARSLDAVDVLRAWCLFAGAILLAWGINRIVTGDKQDHRIGQDTMNFVVAVVAATFGLMALYF
jgi:hypothetical protein